MMTNCVQFTPVSIKRVKSNHNLGVSTRDSAEILSIPEKGVGIEITWADGSVSTLNARYLRENCPCASCSEKGTNKPISEANSNSGHATLRVIQADLDAETNLLEIWSIGKYALGMRWGDQHDTGIYPYDYLRALELAQTKQQTSEGCSHGKCQSTDGSHNHCKNHHHDHGNHNSAHECKSGAEKCRGQIAFEK